MACEFARAKRQAECYVSSDEYSTPRLDGASYRRYRIQKIGRVLEAPPGIFFKEFLKENCDRLWNIFESFKW